MWTESDLIEAENRYLDESYDRRELDDEEQELYWRQQEESDDRYVEPSDEYEIPF